MKQKAQIQMGESVVVIIIIVVLIFVGLMIYKGISQSSDSKKLDDLQSAKAMELSAIIFAMPELHCTFSGTTSSSCFDKLKLEYVASKKDDVNWINYYYDYFGYSKIDVNLVYPYAKNFTVYENNKSTQQSHTPIIIPVNIYDPVTEKYGFGYLSIAKFT
jgi:hypothetical protein